MTEVEMHNGTKLRLEELESAQFSPAGSALFRERGYGQPVTTEADDVLVITMKPIHDGQPFYRTEGENARKNKAALEAFGYPVLARPAKPE